MPDMLAELLDRSTVVPAVNPVEVHPYYPARGPARERAHGIITQAWSPIGGITSYGGGGSSTIDDPVIAQIASEEALSRRT
jgi:diketogulonate reductase-like aldo/keto reductase